MTIPTQDLTDDDLRRALAAAAASYTASEPGELADEMRSAAVIPWPRRRAVQLVSVAAALVVAVLLIAGVTSAGPSAKQTNAKGTLGVPSDAFQSGAGATGGTTGGAAAGVPQSTVGRVSAPGLVPSAPMMPGGAAGDPGVSDSARIVMTGSISLVVDDGKVTAAMARLHKLADRVHGYISDEQQQGVGDSPSGSITLRVPVAAFDAVVAEISGAGFGAKVISSQSSGKDITAEYADTAAQIGSLKAARGRYLTILNAAKSVAEILSVQQRVDDVQGQIDRLEGSRRVLANQSDLATLEVSVNEKAGQVLNTEPSGWSKAWHDAGHGFTSGVESLIAHSGRALLVLLVAVLALLLGRAGWRLARRRLL